MSKPDNLDRRLAILGQFRMADLLDQIATLDEAITAKMDEQLFLNGTLSAAKADLAEAESQVRKIAALNGKNAEERRANQETALATDPEIQASARREMDVRHQVAAVGNELTAMQRKSRRLYVTVESRIAILQFLAGQSVTVAEPPPA